MNQHTEKTSKGRITAAIDWKKDGNFCNPFQKGSIEYHGYCDEQERIILLQELLAEQAMGDVL